MSHSRPDHNAIGQMVKALRDREFPNVSVETFESADAPLAAILIRVRSGTGRIYTVGVESDISEEQARNFIRFALSN